jgi:hypothetical protein
MVVRRTAEFKSDCISSLGIPARGGGDAEGGLQTGGSVLPSRAWWGSLFSPLGIAQRRRDVKRPYADNADPWRTRGSPARACIEFETTHRFREAFQLFTVVPSPRQRTSRPRGPPGADSTAGSAPGGVVLRGNILLGCRPAPARAHAGPAALFAPTCCSAARGRLRCRLHLSGEVSDPERMHVLADPHPIEARLGVDVGSCAHRVAGGRPIERACHPLAHRRARRVRGGRIAFRQLVHHRFPKEVAPPAGLSPRQL